MVRIVTMSVDIKTTQIASLASGIVTIGKIMALPREYFFGHQGLESDEFLGDLLGFGAFALTYVCKKVKGQVVKVSRYGIKDGSRMS